MNDLISNIALTTGVSSPTQTDLYDNMFYVMQQLLKRGMRVDLVVMSFRDNQGDNPHLRKQRIGDQKDLINCLRDGVKVHLVRQQTYLKKKKLDKEKLLLSLQW